ncbi:hypothetical protein ANN_22244 [Periplaneta americana]|uniref:Uncharacterized protein n=1 Tax=Periplaneta americana TaxID=6978 RepID=A0ABQ8S811_PERAM|nr:hypothetical protein ANN_22244 [Periplaneta americana]
MPCPSQTSDFIQVLPRTRSGDIPWPLRSPDLTTLDSLWRKRVERVREFFTRSPKKSVPKASRELPIPAMSVWRPLRRSIWKFLGWLNDVVPDRWIGRKGPNDRACFAWPPRSPDLTPCEFYLWGFIKGRGAKISSWKSRRPNQSLKESGVEGKSGRYRSQKYFWGMWDFKGILGNLGDNGLFHPELTELIVRAAGKKRLDRLVARKAIRTVAAGVVVAAAVVVAPAAVSVVVLAVAAVSVVVLAVAAAAVVVAVAPAAVALAVAAVVVVVVVAPAVVVALAAVSVVVLAVRSSTAVVAPAAVSVVVLAVAAAVVAPAAVSVVVLAVAAAVVAPAAVSVVLVVAAAVVAPAAAVSVVVLAVAAAVVAPAAVSVVVLAVAAAVVAPAAVSVVVLAAAYQ